MEAENAAAALRVLESYPDVGLLFTDIQMPGRGTGWI
jgi:CheY-like chemotaxis protein